MNLLAAKQLEMLHDAVPKAAAVGFLVNPGNPNAAADTAEVRNAAGTLGLALRVASATAEDAIENALATLVQEQARALLIGSDPLFGAHRERLATLAQRYALPAMFNTLDFVHAGGLIYDGPDQNDVYRQAGAYAARILKGEKPADLPVVQPTKFELAINLKTAKAIGLTIPPTLLATRRRGDRMKQLRSRRSGWSLILTIAALLVFGLTPPSHAVILDLSMMTCQNSWPRTKTKSELSWLGLTAITKTNKTRQCWIPIRWSPT